MPTLAAVVNPTCQTLRGARAPASQAAYDEGETLAHARETTSVPVHGCSWVRPRFFFGSASTFWVMEYFFLVQLENQVLRMLTGGFDQPQKVNLANAS